MLQARRALVSVYDKRGLEDLARGLFRLGIEIVSTGGTLADRSVDGHLDQIREHGIERIDLVVVNLYPFRETLASGASFEQTIEMIDIGGPALVRAAAKNFGGVGGVVDPED